MRKGSTGGGSTRTLGVFEVLYVSVGIGLVVGLGELALLGLLRFALDRRLMYSQSVVWMTPLADVAVLLVAAFLLILVSLAWRRVASLGVVVSTSSFIGLMCLMVVERHFALWAMALLALGAAVQAGRLAAARPDGFLRLARRVAVVLATVFLLTGAGVETGLKVAERRTEAGLVEAAPGASNVIFIILDTVRARTLGLYGYDRETTPNLERLARRGVTFDWAIAPATWTVPSHGTMFSSEWPRDLAPWLSSSTPTPLFPMIAAVMQERGYRTGGFIANWYQLSRASGFGVGFIHYDDHGYSTGQIARCSSMIQWVAQRRLIRKWIGKYETIGRRRAREISGSFLGWLDESRGDRPFFAFLNYLDAHAPYLPPPPFNTMFGPNVSDREPVIVEELNRTIEATPEIVRAETDAYDGSIAFLDAEIGRLFDELERRAVLENTYVIIGSDHGDELGEHGRWGHAASLHEEVVHVPLLIFGPGVPVGLRIDEPASLRDIPATIAAFAGSAAPFHGSSLAGYWGGGPNVGSSLPFSEYNGFYSIYSDGLHYVQRVRDRVESLYDLQQDPLETADLAQVPEMRARLDSIRAFIRKLRPAADSTN